MVYFLSFFRLVDHTVLFRSQFLSSVLEPACARDRCVRVSGEFALLLHVTPSIRST
jgi:hypothetical protein